MTLNVNTDQVYGLYLVMLHCDRFDVVVNDVSYTDDKFVMKFNNLPGKVTILDSSKVETEEFPWDGTGVSVMTPYDFVYKLRLNYPLN